MQCGVDFWRVIWYRFDLIEQISETRSVSIRVVAKVQRLLQCSS